MKKYLGEAGLGRLLSLIRAALAEKADRSELDEQLGAVAGATGVRSRPHRWNAWSKASLTTAFTWSAFL